MEPHTHPSLERNITDIARLVHQLTQAALASNERMDRLTGTVETLTAKLDSLTVKLDSLATRVDGLAVHLEAIDLRLLEAADKLNGVIDLMNRHLQEPHNGLN